MRIGQRERLRKQLFFWLAAGERTVYVGASSDDFRLSGDVMVVLTEADESFLAANQMEKPFLVDWTAQEERAALVEIPTGGMFGHGPGH